MAGNPDGGVKTMLVSANGNPAATYSFATSGYSTTNMGWTTKTYTFTATGASTTLSFTSQNPGVSGPALDDVQVIDLNAIEPVVAVPTLSQWSLLALGALLALQVPRHLKNHFTDERHHAAGLHAVDPGAVVLMHRHDAYGHCC